jgi:hypothetical protein
VPSAPGAGDVNTSEESSTVALLQSHSQLSTSVLLGALGVLGEKCNKIPGCSFTQ